MLLVIMWMTSGPIDTSKSYEFTDWNDVDTFSKKFKSMNKINKSRLLFKEAQKHIPEE